MKKQILTLIAFAGSALASQTTVQVKVPFAFTAGPASLPAGTYVIEEMGPNCVLIRGAGKRAMILNRMLPGDIDSSGKIRLRFGRNAAGYVLEGIQSGTAGDVAGRK